MYCVQSNLGFDVMFLHSTFFFFFFGYLLWSCGENLDYFPIYFKCGIVNGRMILSNFNVLRRSYIVYVR